MYEFITTGGCSRCDAYDGVHEHDPGRPHPNCECQIVDRSSSCPNYEIEHTGNTRTPPENHLTMHGRVDVRCCIVGSSSRTFSVAFDDVNPPDAIERFVEEGTALAMEMMRDCDLVS